MDYSFFIQYWWFIISLLGALLVFLLFVQGGQSVVPQLAKTELEKTLLINSIGRKWEFTFTTLVTFGGAFFASFPLFYSTSFGGAYWVWMIILICFVLQAVAFEFRRKDTKILGQKTYETFLLINGFGATFLLGVAVGTFFTGSEFIVNKDNLINAEFPAAVSQWQNPLHGLEALFNWRNLLLGATVLMLARTSGLLYLINNVADDTIFERAKKHLLYNGLAFVVLFVCFLVATGLSDGFAVVDGVVQMQSYKYAINLIEMPLVLVILALGVVGVLYGIGRTVISQKPYRKGIWFEGSGVVLAVLALLLLVGYNNTAYYPSTTSLESSLTIYNSSSSYFTLKVMSIVSLLIPFVLSYIFYTWRVMDKTSISKKEIETEGAKY